MLPHTMHRCVYVFMCGFCFILLNLQSIYFATKTVADAAIFRRLFNIVFVDSQLYTEDITSCYSPMCLQPKVCSPFCHYTKISTYSGLSLLFCSIPWISHMKIKKMNNEQCSLWTSMVQQLYKIFSIYCTIVSMYKNGALLCLHVRVDLSLC